MILRFYMAIPKPDKRLVRVSFFIIVCWSNGSLSVSLPMCPLREADGRERTEYCKVDYTIFVVIF